MASKKRQDKRITRCTKLVAELVTICAPGDIQRLLSEKYRELANSSESEAELMFWDKCSRSSNNLSSGMNKWAHEMIDEIEEGGESETEGG